MTAFEREQRAAVLQHDAGAGNGDAGAEPVKQAVDERDHVAVAVDNGEVDGVARRHELPIGGGDAALDGGRRLLAADALALPGGVVLRDDRLHGQLGALGVGQPGIQVGERELFRLEQQVQVSGRVMSE